MFTGLVQARGTVSSTAEDGSGGRTITIREASIAAVAVLGESISVSGVCLSVVSKTAEEIQFQVGPETLAKTTLGMLGDHSPVNLERALRVGDALGGHFVTGHVDCVGQIAEVKHSGEWATVTFEYDSAFDDLLVNKGSIAVDGVSLTLVDVQAGLFSVMLIPHTLTNTTLGVKRVSDSVNLEFDLLAKHVRKMLKNLTITW